MEGDMEILIVEPGRPPRTAAIAPTVEAMEQILGGTVQLGCFLPQRVMLASRQDTEGLVPNRCMPGGEGHICGTFLLCGIPEKGKDLASIAPGQREAFQVIFAEPGEFMEIGGTVYSDPDDVADAVYRLWETMQDGESVQLTKWGGRPDKDK